jgi:hypothetical protein
MPRGRRREVTASDSSALERELQQIKAREAEIRALLRRQRNTSTEVRKLEEKLRKQLAGARWVANQIRQLEPGWNEVGFYNSVEPKQPTPRGRRPRSAAAPTTP